AARTMPDKPDWSEVKDVFSEALELTGEARSRFLEERCADRPELQREVESLLSESTDDKTDFLDVSAISMFDVPTLEVGSELGGYRLRSVIGEGGMGRVFEATQEHPHRTVALKVLRPGFFSPDAERRFHYEVEALGKLSHEGIARVFDAGSDTTPEGHEVAWFAMERIHGRPFLAAADALGLDRPARLRLFLRTADAVAHAHQRGILHRDLKPDNILVDEAGHPRVLDFGIARALDPHASTVTSTGEIVGTISYMSPEQVLGDPTLVDARSDVYALGVLLYRLLTNRAPIDLSGVPLPKAAMLLAEGRPTPAGVHDATLRGDLETILSKALEHDVDRRYGTVDALSSDIRATLDNRPISARPPTTIYQLQRFARRNRGLVAGLALALLALVGGLIGTSFGLVRAASARDAAETERDRAKEANAFLERLLESADPESGSQSVRVVDLLRQASVELNTETPEGGLDAAVRASMHRTIGDTYLRLGLADEAKPHLKKSYDWSKNEEGDLSAEALKALSSLVEVALREEDLPHADELLADLESAREALNEQAPLWLRVNPTELRAAMAEAEGDLARSLALRQDAFARWRTIEGEGQQNTEVARAHLANALVAAGFADGADDLLQQGIEILRKDAGEYHPRLMTQELLRAQIAVDQREFARGLEALERLRERGEIVWGPNHGDTMALLGSYGDALVGLGRMDEAVAIQTDVLERSERVFGDSHRTTLTRRGNLATTLMYAERFEEAEVLLRQNLAYLNGPTGIENPFMVLQIELPLSAALEKLGRFDDALPLSQSVVGRLHDLVGPGHPQSLISSNNLAMLYLKLDRASEALPIATEVVRLAEEHQPGSRMNVFPLRSNLARALAGAGRFEDAIAELLRVHGALKEDENATEIEIARVRELLAETYAAWNKLDEAERWR
ncbi:MAG: serine/threonine-protein kinase, partial [Planctomycetota bacterium]